MSSPSNIYAEKIFAEHPLSLWSLDDKSDYISIISENQRDLSDWSISQGSSVASIPGISSQPFKDSFLYRITGNPSLTTTQYTTLISPDIISFQDLNQELDSFSISSYIYSESTHINYIAIGYEYNDVYTAEVVRNLKEVSVSVFEKWMLVGETFVLPQQNTSMRLVIKIGYSPSEEDSSHYTFLVNGLSFGQWSEEFYSESLGSELQELPSSINIEESYGLTADAYGLLSNKGYYLSKNNYLVAKNFGVPLVYGSSNVTFLSPNQDINGEPKPSLIIPGLGFLNDVGRYKEYTLEMWMRITSNATEPKRIVGPIGSTDGLYVDGAFITLVIDGNYKTKFVGEWCRPMLIQLCVGINSASVILNGESVINLNIDTENIGLPTEYSDSKNQDWIGFYSYEDISPVEVDCIAIYPYIVPEVVAKRRWVYGQAVGSIERVNETYNGTASIIDYTYANYGSNYSYPNNGSWKQGTIDNLIATTSSLTNPDYKLPEIFIDKELSTFETEYPLTEIYNECLSIQPNFLDPANTEPANFFSFDPGQGTGSVSLTSYFKFNTLSPISEQTSGIYGIFKQSYYTETPQTLILIENKSSNDKFKIESIGEKVYYKFISSGIETELDSFDFNINELFTVGINLSNVSSYFGNKIVSFFGNKSLLNTFIGNTKELDSQFLGYIYKIGFTTERNFNYISSEFQSNGIANIQGNLIDHTASYTLISKVEYDKYELDIAISGYWEDYIPLSYFGKYTKTASGTDKYSLDFLQFNINYPSPSSFKQIEEAEEWTYKQLNDKFSNQSYEILDNALYTGYGSYSDLQANRSVLNYQYDTSRSFVRSYVSFQLISSGANNQSNFFNHIEPALKNSVIDLSEFPLWLNTKFEVVNDTIIYPPKGIDFEKLAIVTHLEFNVPGILDKKLSIKSLEYASQSLSETGNNFIGTGLNTKIYPYRKDGVYYSNNGQNPFSIYKKSSPYLHLTRYSGIQLRGKYIHGLDRGLSIPINKNKTLNYEVNSLQLAMRFDDDFFPVSPHIIFKVKTKDSTLSFFMVANSTKGDRAKIYAIDSKSGTYANGISYYLNGRLVSDPVINLKQWSFLGFGFANSLNFSNYSGSIDLTGPVLFNNISYYQTTNLKQKQSVFRRLWDNVLQQYYPGQVNSEIFLWQKWDESYQWQNVLILSTTSSFGVTPHEIYNSYVGTNKIIIDSQKEFMFLTDHVSIYKDIIWQQQVTTPV